MKLGFYPAAVQDLREIHLSTAERWGIEQADYYVDAVHDAAISLLDNPQRGEAFDKFRFIPSGKHLLFYSVEQETVNIVRVLHNRMDVSKRLGLSR